jgi:hypothetical protein
MTTKVVLEPAMALQNIVELNYYLSSQFKSLSETIQHLSKSLSYIDVLSDDKDELSFPHVDSCLAVVYKTDDDRLIGGHVGAIWPGETEPDYSQNLNRVLETMNMRLGEAKIIEIYLIGSSNWNSVIQSLTAPGSLWHEYSLECAIKQFDTSPYSKGVDVTFSNQQMTMHDLAGRIEERVDKFDEPLSPKKTASVTQTTQALYSARTKAPDLKAPVNDPEISPQEMSKKTV